MKRTSILALLGILLVTSLLYTSGLGLYFVSDDFGYLALAANMHSLADIVPFLQGGCTRIGWPIVILAFWIARLVGGMQPFVYHLMSLGIQLINIVLVYLLVRRLLTQRASLAPLLAAAIVAFHPREAESVMWLAALTWPVGTLFSVIMAHCYLSWRNKGSPLWLVGAIGAGAVASLSNPGSAVMPALLALYDVLRRQWRASTVLAWAALGVAATVPALSCGVGGMINTPASGYGLSLAQGITQVPLYAAMTWWPVQPRLKDLLPAAPLAFVAVMLVTALAVLVASLYAWRRGTILVRWGLAWAILGVMAPSFFAPLLFDRYMSLMLVGVAMFFAGVIEELQDRVPGPTPGLQRAAWAIFVIWAVLALGQGRVRIDQWRAAVAIVSEVRSETLARYPQVAKRSSFFFVGLPDTIYESHVWSCCIDSAIRIWYNDTTLKAKRAYNHGAVNTPGRSDLILDFSDRSWAFKQR